MQIAMFYHSLISDWNHGNAHFLRGVVTELRSRGHDVRVYEPADAWSVQNLVADHGEKAITGFHRAYPGLDSVKYDLKKLSLDKVLDGADMVIVHEWNDHDLVRLIGEHRAERGGYVLLFHDTHHRAVTDSKSMADYDLSNYDGVLAFGNVLRDLYIKRGWAARAWTWHEAADTRVFRPITSLERKGDLVCIGNWGDDERTAELHEFLLGPVKALRLKAKVYGVRYPESAIKALADAGIEYGGYLPNYEAPRVFSQYRVTVHVPRRPYVQALPGIPTIRPFEALACGIPLICSPWNDAENMFRAGRDYLTAHNGEEMKEHLSAVLNDDELAHNLAVNGRRTIQAAHTCAHRVDGLLNIYKTLRSEQNACRTENSILRLKPGLGLLERRCNLLPGDSPCSR